MLCLEMAAFHTHYVCGFAKTYILIGTRLKFLYALYFPKAKCFPYSIRITEYFRVSEQLAYHGLVQLLNTDDSLPGFIQASMIIFRDFSRPSKSLYNSYQ